MLADHTSCAHPSTTFSNLGDQQSVSLTHYHCYIKGPSGPSVHLEPFLRAFFLSLPKYFPPKLYEMNWRRKILLASVIGKDSVHTQQLFLLNGWGPPHIRDLYCALPIGQKPAASAICRSRECTWHWLISVQFFTGWSIDPFPFFTAPRPPGPAAHISINQLRHYTFRLLCGGSLHCTVCHTKNSAGNCFQSSFLCLAHFFLLLRDIRFVTSSRFHAALNKEIYL